MKEYSKGIYVKFKPEEVEILHDRMKEAGVQNMSAYIRKMAINGYVIIPEWPDLNRVISLHARISNNLNQYAKKANETGKLYEEDIAEIKMMNNEQTELLKKAQLLTGKGIDPEYKDADMDYEVTRADIKILKQIHSLGDEQYKRLMAYIKALQKLPELCSTISWGAGMVDNRVTIYDYANGARYESAFLVIM